MKRIPYFLIATLCSAAIGSCADNTDSADNSTAPVSDSDSSDESTDGSDADTTQNDTTPADTAAETGFDTENLEWQNANLTWYESYPDPGSAECIEYNGCLWEGLFAGLDGKQPLEWVQANNIAAVHSDDFPTYNGKTLRLRYGDEHQIDVVVYDMCADSDCDGCCTNNMFATGFLIDLEIHTAERFGVMGGIVEFACLNCE